MYCGNKKHNCQIYRKRKLLSSVGSMKYIKSIVTIASYVLWSFPGLSNGEDMPPTNSYTSLGM